MRAVVAVSVALGAMLAVLGTGHRASAATTAPLLFGENLLYANGLFGTAPVYYEFGNETDLPGRPVTASDCVSKWNAVVPSLKAAANAGAQFIGNLRRD